MTERFYRVSNTHSSVRVISALSRDDAKYQARKLFPALFCPGDCLAAKEEPQKSEVLCQRHILTSDPTCAACLAEVID